ncbi:unnamed protein product, partial [Prunus brigantina]
VCEYVRAFPKKISVLGETFSFPPSLNKFPSSLSRYPQNSHLLTFKLPPFSLVTPIHPIPCLSIPSHRHSLITLIQSQTVTLSASSSFSDLCSLVVSFTPLDASSSARVRNSDPLPKHKLKKEGTELGGNECLQVHKVCHSWGRSGGQDLHAHLLHQQHFPYGLCANCV